MSITPRIDINEGDLEINPEDKQKHMDLIDSKAEALRKRYAVDV